jgi:hypothetical protein
MDAAASFEAGHEGVEVVGRVVLPADLAEALTEPVLHTH